MESMRTRSRGKQQNKNWRSTNEDSDVDEEEEEADRVLPVVSGENKRKRAPRGGAAAVRRVKLKPLTQYEAARDEEKEEDVSGSTGDPGIEQEDGKQNEVESYVEKRRESLRVKMKPLKLRESTEAKSTPKASRTTEKKDLAADEAEAASEERLESKVKGEGKQQKSQPNGPVLQHKSAGPLTKSTPSQTPPKQSPKAAPGGTPNGKKLDKPAAAAQEMDASGTGSESKGQDRSDEAPETELDISLKVLRKIMKMDAAQPFNTPVDPEAQGVPDYLKIIDKPMDFGTIVENLEKGQKYKNAFDVYQDIQQIWFNCRKFNRKGDPILELMKKVQKACSKYWTAAGVLRDPKKSKKGEAPPPAVERPERPAEIFIAKTNSHMLDDAKLRPGAGTSNHKASCACVVCSNVRRRAAREKRAVGLGSARAVKRQMAKLKNGKQDMQDMNECELDEAMQFEDGYLEYEEEADQFFPSSYQIPLRPLNPAVLSISRTLFGGCSRGSRTSNLVGASNPFVAVLSSWLPRS